jgi:flagella basal body P-ring formation protein FlgA
VLGLPSRRARGRASSASPPPATTLRFRASEAARVTVALTRARKGRRSKGACSTRAKRGRRCTAWSTARTIRRAATGGQNDITLRARGLKPGRYRVVLTATDEVGNRSPRRTLGLRVVRLHR